MRKGKIIGLFIMLMIIFTSYNVVNAAAQLPDNAARISSAVITQTKTGTGPWDADDAPGNDSSESNNIVRSFDQVTWTIENTFAINGTESSSYNGGKIYFEAKLPNVFTKETAKWKTEAMAWIENPKVSSDGLTLTGSYSMSPDMITIPGKQSLVFVLDVLGASNGTEFQPTIKTWLNGNAASDYVTTVPEKITVSAAANYNIKLIHNGNCANRVTLDIDGTDVTGRLYGYAVVYELYNKTTAKGLRGIEYPKGDITLDLDLNLLKKPADSSVMEDITDINTPILYNYQIAGAGKNNTKIPGRSMWGIHSWAYGSNNSFPYGKVGGARYSAYDSGNISIVQDGAVLHTTLSGYKFNGVFPDHNAGYSSTSAISYTQNIGVFGSIYMQIMVPDWDDYSDTTDYYFKVTDKNFNATSISGLNTTTQQVTSDDTSQIQYVKTKRGSFTSLVYIYKRDGLTDKGMLHTLWNYGDGRVEKGQQVFLRSTLEQGIANDDDEHMRAVNVFYKFDADCYLPVVVNGTKYVSGGSKMNWDFWYVTKKDGTNWESQVEMNSTLIDNCVIYTDLSDVPEGDQVIGVFYQSKEGGCLDERDYTLNLPTVIKDTAVIGETYACTQNVIYWKTDIDRSIYNVENVIAGNATWPTENVAMDITKNYRNYKKTEYDADGIQISGTHAGGTYYGNTVQIVGANQSITLSTVNPKDNSKKINFDISKNEYDVRYKIEPKITSQYNSGVNTTGVAVNLTVTLPAGVTYKANSCALGEPELTTNANGTTTLVWTVTNCTVNETIPPVYFDAHISEESLNGKQYEVKVEMLADSEKVGTTKLENRTTTATIQVINLSSHRLYKSVSTPVIEKSGQIHYTVSYKNNTDEVITKFQLLDILPFNGDGRGSNFHGNYRVHDIEVTMDPVSNLTTYYTLDTDVREKDCQDPNLTQGMLEWRGNNSGLPMTAYVLKGTIGGQGYVNIDVYLDTYDNKGLDTYVNNAAAQIYTTTEPLVTSSVEARVIQRELDGYVWFDANGDGIMDDNEERLSGRQIRIYTEDHRDVFDNSGQVVGPYVTTDANGYYSFKELPKANFIIEYTLMDNLFKVYTMTKKEVGINAAVNSKFNEDPVKDNGAIEYYETDVITKLNSVDLPELKASNINAGITKRPTKVVVNYLDIDTNDVLNTQITIDGRIDDEYETVNKLTDINKRNGNKYEFVKVDGKVSGTMTPDTIVVTYWYQKKMADIEVNYLEKGTNTVLSTKVTSQDRVDKPYTTVNKLDEINAANGNKYEFVETTGAAVNGTYKVDKQVINYWYQKKPANVIVSYKEVGTETVLNPQVEKTGRVDDEYTTENKLDAINAANGNKYEFVKVDGNPTGNMAVDTTYVTYWYQKKMSSIEVNYLEKGTNTVLSTKVTTSGRIDSDYTTENKLDEINAANGNKYEFVETTGAAVNGTYKVDKQVINYWYQKKPANVIVSYKEVGTETELNPQVEKTGRVDDEYTTENKLDAINAANGNKYEFVKVDGNSTGNMAVDTTYVTYWYQKKMSSIEVNYLEKGTNTVLSTKVTTSGRIDSDYTTENKLDAINAENENKYEFVETTGAATSGKYTVDKQVINYYYQKKMGEIEVNYLEKGTNTVLETKVTKTDRVDNEYSTENKLDVINTNNNNKYRFVETTGDSTTGVYKLNKQVITYWYEKKPTSVITKYVDIDTNEEIYDQATINGKIDDEYTTVNELTNINKKFNDVYEFVSDTKNTSGNMTEAQIEVIYYYQKTATSVLVEYKEKGTDATLAQSETIEGRIDDNYTTTDKIDTINAASGNKYELVETTGDAVTGKMTQAQKHIVYWYQKKATNVIIEYKEVGTETALLEQIELTGRVDDAYTTQNKLAEINNKFANKYEFVKVDGTVEGNMTLDTQYITYWYQKKMSSIEVNHLEKGTEAVLADQVTKSDRIDANYTTEDKLDEINAANDSKYEFVETTGAATEGTYQLEKQVINYYYQKKATNVIISYKEIGSEAQLSNVVAVNGRIDDDYTSENKLDEINQTYGNKYEFVKVDGNTSGKMTADTTYVTYWYQKKMAEVEVNYLEKGTETALLDKISMTDRVDQPYYTDNKINDINLKFANKYEFVETTGATVNGSYTVEKQIVNYWYQKKLTNVITKYVDVDTNEEIYDRAEIAGRVDDEYNTVNELDNINKNFDNKYEFVRVEGEASGNMTLDTITVTYYYQKKLAEVEVNYKEVGTENVLFDQITLKDQIDKNYVTENKIDEINAANGDKYEFVETTGAARTGKYTLDKQEITYWYQKKETEVIVRYYELGTETKLVENVVKEGRIDDPYTTENKLDEINEKFANKYEFVRVDGITEGNMTLDTQFITYWYQKKPTKVITKYIDKDSNEEIYLTNEQTGRVDDEYTTVNELDRINEKYENIYEFVESTSNTSGNMTIDTINVVYYYQKKMSSIEVNYVELETNLVLADKVEKTGKIDSSYTTENKLDEINGKYNNSYEYVKVTGTPEGTYKLEKQVITYYYVKKGTKVIVDYVDADTNESIYDTAIINGRVNDEYHAVNELENINAKYENKYEFVNATENRDGNMTLDTIHVIFYYSKKVSEVEVLYKEVGSEIELADKVTMSGKVDSKYETTNKLDEINETYDNIYEFIEVKGKEVGTYTLDKQTITYWYDRKPTNVIVNYVDIETEEKLAEESEITGKVKDNYVTGDMIDIINKEQAPHVYKLVEISGEPNGQMSLDTTYVTYYYKKLRAPVIVKHVDEYGNVLGEEEQEVLIGEEVESKPSTFDGYYCEEEKRIDEVTGELIITYHYKKIEEPEQVETSDMSFALILVVAICSFYGIKKIKFSKNK